MSPSFLHQLSSQCSDRETVGPRIDWHVNKIFNAGEEWRQFMSGIFPPVMLVGGVWSLNLQATVEFVVMN
jgi:hypothetical protein